MRIEVTRAGPAFEGAPFGDTGPYEMLAGRLWGEVDPAHPLNAVIADLGLAPVNAAGRVEYDCDFHLLKPAGMHRGNRRILYDVLNRGGKVALHTLNDAPRDAEGTMRMACNDPATLADAGNGFLMRQGYTLLWTGWQGRGAIGEGAMAARLPVAQGVTGISREEYVFDHPRSPVTAALSYPAAAMEQAACTLTVRQYPGDPRTAIPAGGWRFVSDTQIEIDRPAGFDAGAIYEFAYPAREATVMGLGFAAVRDAVSFLRHEGPGNPLTGIEHVLAYGMSQAGRFLRDFLHLGFNQDLEGRRVFDGVMACMAGSRRAFVNHRFAQPGRFARQHEDRLFPHDQFPFAYAVTTDPVSGRTDGILARCEETGTSPRVIQTESSADFFQGRASLLATDGLGNDIPVPENVRLYHFAGIQHGGGGDPTLDYARLFPCAAYPPNLADCSGPHRALLTALDRWVSGDALPPPGAFPAAGGGTLVPAAPERYGFPAIPGVTYSGAVNALAEMDYSADPPRAIPGRNYAVLVPAIDADGNERTGVRVPEIAVPVGTHTGWNPRRPGYAGGALSPIGAFLPFAATREERIASGDPRPSLAERYPEDADRERKLVEAAEDLCRRGLLLTEDAAGIAAGVRRRPSRGT
ncbi:alpha/beta hydrolase domain-containing protein [Sphingomonas canadensis]|uniref:Alpha/beta hydrolase domain-containing protein n=1 Tax=Sphingomonas canadensis TaxID=1219257 RepID=A0ABW3HD58_9SPHN|nr:alpha/beta hydrolase domain-containing protein [Sphingomonas canadensis]MCW3838246.1 alpha/beta hydrolase domain-containing protein [Sphingomonas canadensis]